MNDLVVALVLRLVDRLTAPMRRIGGALRGLGRAGDAVRRQLAGLLGPAAALTAALSAGSILGFTTQYASAAEAVGNLSLRLGAGVEELQAYQHAAGEADIQVGTFNTALQRLNRRMADAAAGDNDDLAALFRRAGISLRDANGELRTSVDLLPELADLFERNDNAALRTAMAFALFDSEGVAMVQMLAHGSEALAATTGEFTALGGAIGEEAAGAAAEFNRRAGLLRVSTLGLRNAIGAGLLPVLTPLIEDLTAWIAANRDLISQRVHQVVTALAAAIAEFDWAAFGGWLIDIADGIEQVVDLMGGWEVAAIALVALLNAGLIVAIAQVVAALWGLAAAVYANPIFWAVAAIAGAAYLIYRDWGDVAPWFERLWRNVEDIFGGFIDFVLGVFTLDFERALGGWTQLGEGLVGLFGTIWDGVRGVFLAFVGWVDDTFGTDLTAAVTEIEAAWAGLGDWFGGLWGDVEQAFHGAWEVIEPIVDLIAGAIDRVTGLVESMSTNVDATLSQTLIPTGQGREVTGLEDNAAAILAQRRLRAAAQEPAPAPGVAGAQDVGGRLDIALTVDNRRTDAVVTPRPNNPRALDYQVDAGAIMVGGS